MALMKCIFCGRFAQGVTKHGDWICNNCMDKIGGIRKWFKIRNMTTQELLAAMKTPVKTKILDHGGGVVAIKKGGVGRAVVGDIFFGGAGAVVGSVTGKRGIDRNDYTVFKVWYEDGTDDIQKVPHTSELYEKYLSLLED